MPAFCFLFCVCENFNICYYQLPYYFMVITLIILVLSAVFFMSGKVRSDLVALCALISLLIFQILTPEEALSGFSNSVVIMMVGLFVVGGAIFQTGLAKMISSKILKLAGKSELRLFLLVMLVTSAIGAFVSNTGTVALMLPIVVSLAVSAGMNPSRLLMPLAFASSMGGMMTLIGTPPNLVIQNALTSAGFEPLSFFSFLPVGLICVTIGTLVLMPLTKWFLSKKGKIQEVNASGKSLNQLVKEYGLSSNLFRLRADTSSLLVGKTIIDLDVRRKYGLNILEVRRGDISQNRFLKTITQKLAEPDTVMQEQDVLYVTGEVESVERFAEDYLLEMLDGHTTEEAAKANNSLDFYDIGIAEIVLMPSSNLANRTVKDADLRGKFNVNVLGIRRKKEYILQDLGNEKMHSGDVLLVQGTWQDIARLSKEDADWVVLGQPLNEAAKVTLDYKAPVAAAIMVLMVVMMVFDFIPVAPVTAVMIAGVLMVITGCFRNVEAAYKTINWETIVLFAGMLPMSLALEKTGASEYISNSLVTGLGSYGPIVLMAGIYFTTSLMTMFISNTVTAVLMAPIALQSALQIGVSPVPFLFAVTVAASMCFASPFSTPPNALVMPAGQYTFMDYIKVGLPLQVIMGIVMVFALPLLFPF
ncbi:Na+/sulfate transporter [Bacteroides salyersiae]|jgi:di/tricarboxylate transporter|nr:Na+/sulfate transporter [Bacteroides salyersiae]